MSTESHDSCSYLDLNIRVLNGRFSYNFEVFHNTGLIAQSVHYSGVINIITQHSFGKHIHPDKISCLLLLYLDVYVIYQEIEHLN